MASDSDDAEKSYWFGAKTIGIGYQPTSWQGWLLTIVAVVAMFGAFRLSFLLLHGGPVAAGVGVAAILVIAGVYLWIADRHASPDAKFLG